MILEHLLVTGPSECPEDPDVFYFVLWKQYHKKMIDCFTGCLDWYLKSFIIWKESTLFKIYEWFLIMVAFSVCKGLTTFHGIKSCFQWWWGGKCNTYRVRSSILKETSWSLYLSQFISINTIIYCRMHVFDGGVSFKWNYTKWLRNVDRIKGNYTFIYTITKIALYVKTPLYNRWDL